MKFIDPIKLLSKIEFNKYGNITTTIGGLRIAMGKSEVEAEPVKHGKWHSRYYYRKASNFYDCEVFVCGECQAEFSYDAETGVQASDWHYCPNCGAKMGADVADKPYSPKCSHNIEAEEGEE